MSKISEPGYLFIHSGVLEKDQIEKSLLDSIDYIYQNYNKDFRKTKFLVNVVKNKDGLKYGHTYAWIENKELFYALIGKNFDGLELVEWVEDPDWTPPEKNYHDAMAEAGDDDWVAWDEIERAYQRPKKKVVLDPLVSLPAVKYTPEQEKEINYESKFGFLELFPIKLSRKTGKLNTLFTNDIPEWITEDMLFNYFKVFEQDNRLHSDKKNKFRYPLVKIKSKKDIRKMRRFCTITFSNMYSNTASFLINVVKRIEFCHKDQKALLFFSQSKSKNDLN